MHHAVRTHAVSERAACLVLAQHRSTQRREANAADDEPFLFTDMRRLSVGQPRFGYRRIHMMLVREGWHINRKRLRRLWWREGMRVLRKCKKRRSIGNPANSCIRRKAGRKNHVWT